MGVNLGNRPLRLGRFRPKLARVRLRAPLCPRASRACGSVSKVLRRVRAAKEAFKTGERGAHGARAWASCLHGMPARPQGRTACLRLARAGAGGPAPAVTRAAGAHRAQCARRQLPAYQALAGLRLGPPRRAWSNADRAAPPNPRDRLSVPAACSDTRGSGARAPQNRLAPIFVLPLSRFNSAPNFRA